MHPVGLVSGTSPKRPNPTINPDARPVRRLSCPLGVISKPLDPQIMNAENIFEEMKAFVSAACNAKDHSLAVQAAEKFGFCSVPTGSLSQIFADLRYKDPNGSEISLVAKWLDPSGPFQNLPDINRILLTLKMPGQSPIEYRCEYRDLT